MAYISKSFVLLLGVLLSFSSLKAQNVDSLIKDTTIYNNSQVDKIAEFPGGSVKIYQLFGKNFRFTQAAVKNRAKGKQIINFVLEKDGSISNITFSATIGYGLEEETVRILKMLPNWNPALIKGLPVRSKVSDFPMTLTVGE